MRLPVLAICLALPIAACSTEQGGTRPIATGSPVLIGTWVAEEIEAERVTGATQSTISFEAGNRVDGAAGCNRFFGHADIEGDTITFGPLGTTRMACAPDIMDQEQRFLDALAAARSYRLDGRSLLLMDEAGTRLLRLIRHQ